MEINACIFFFEIVWDIRRTVETTRQAFLFHFFDRLTINRRVLIALELFFLLVFFLVLKFKIVERDRRNRLEAA